MRIKILSLFASALLVAACATEPEDSGKAKGTGSSTQTSAAAAPKAAAPKAVAPKKKKKKMPPGAPAGSAVEFYVKVGDRVFFDLDKSEITQKAAATLKRQAAWLQKWGKRTIVVEGHCDERGTREYNLALGERRATAARDYLIAFGLNSSRLRTTSYGKERPYALGHNEESWSLNRRSVTVVN